MMTVSAVARLMPSPPARVDSRNAKSLEPGALKCSIAYGPYSMVLGCGTFACEWSSIGHQSLQCRASGSLSTRKRARHDTSDNNS